MSQKIILTQQIINDTLNKQTLYLRVELMIFKFGNIFLLNMAYSRHKFGLYVATILATSCECQQLLFSMMRSDASSPNTPAQDGAYYRETIYSTPRF